MRKCRVEEIEDLIEELEYLIYKSNDQLHRLRDLIDEYECNQEFKSEYELITSTKRHFERKVLILRKKLDEMS